METTDKEAWSNYFKQHGLPVRDNLSFDTVDGWQAEFDRTKTAWDKKEQVIKQLIKDNELTLTLIDTEFDHYLTVLKSLSINTDKWLEESDDYDETVIFKEPVKSIDIYITKPYTNRKGWLIEFDNCIGDTHIGTTFVVPFKKLNEFIFIGLYGQMFN